MRREDVVAMRLGDVVQERLHNRGAAPGITSREILSRGPLCPTKWKAPERAPTEEEKRRMLGKMLEMDIILCMDHHYYMMEDKIKKQEVDAATGLRLSEALGRAFGLDWDGRLIQKLTKLGWTPLMIKRYVDDLNAVMKALKAGTRYNAEEDRLEVVEATIESDNDKKWMKSQCQYLDKLPKL